MVDTSSEIVYLFCVGFVYAAASLIAFQRNILFSLSMYQA